MSGPGHRSLARGGCSRHKGDHTQLTTMGTWGMAPWIVRCWGDRLQHPKERARAALARGQLQEGTW